MSHLLQADLAKLIAKKNLNYKILDGGGTPPSYMSPPKSTIHLIQTNFFRPRDWAMQQKYAGGRFYRIHLSIDDHVPGSSDTIERQNLKKFNGRVHVKCVIYRGESWDNRYNRNCKLDMISPGVYYLMETQDFTVPYAEKVLRAINNKRPTGSRLVAF